MFRLNFRNGSKGIERARCVRPRAASLVVKSHQLIHDTLRVCMCVFRVSSTPPTLFHIGFSPCVLIKYLYLALKRFALGVCSGVVCRFSRAQ